MDHEDDRQPPNVAHLGSRNLTQRFFESHINGELASRLGVDPHNFNRDELIHVMDAVRDLMDAKSRMDRSGWHGRGPDSYTHKSDRLDLYLQDFGLISDLHEDDDLCRVRVLMDWGEVLNVLRGKSNNAKPSRVGLMTALGWYRLESAVDDGERPTRTLATEVDISHSTLRTLWARYDRAGRVGRRELHKFTDY